MLAKSTNPMARAVVMTFRDSAFCSARERASRVPLDDRSFMLV